MCDEPEFLYSLFGKEQVFCSHDFKKHCIIKGILPLYVQGGTGSGGCGRNPSCTED